MSICQEEESNNYKMSSAVGNLVTKSAKPWLGSPAGQRPGPVPGLSLLPARWVFDVFNWKPNQSEWEKAIRCIQPEEKLRIERFVFKEDVKRSLIGRLLMRKLCSESLRIPYQQLRLARNAKDRPYLIPIGKQELISLQEPNNLESKDHPFNNLPEQLEHWTIGAPPATPTPTSPPTPSQPINTNNESKDENHLHHQNNDSKVEDDVISRTLYDFNISHQGHYCVLAAETDSSVGIDVMNITHSLSNQSLPEMFNLMRRKFTSSEWDFICGPGLTEKEQANRFYRNWSLKESFVKAEGSGLGFNLQRLSFHCATARLSQSSITVDTTLFIDGELAEEWYFEECLLDQEHCVVVALLKPEKCLRGGVLYPVKFRRLSFSELIENAKEQLDDDPNTWKKFQEKPQKTPQPEQENN